MEGPQDAKSDLDLVFSTTVTNVTPTWDHDNNAGTDPVAKTLILSAYDSTNHVWYSQTDTNAGPKTHTLDTTKEVYWYVYEVVVSSNYGDFTAAQKAEIDFELTDATSGSYYNKKFSCTFAGKAVDSTYTDVASCFIIDANNMAVSTAPTGVDTISFNLRDWAATSGTGALNHGSVTKYLVVYVDGTTRTHTGVITAGVAGTASIATIGG